MVRFALHPNATSIQKLQALQAQGITYAFSALFKPRSIRRSSDGAHKQFEHEQEILELMQTIDGSRSDESLFGFLNYDKIKDGHMCRHMVFVLPYCASCDALENLLTSNESDFCNLQEYQIINISGVDNPNAYPSVRSVKTAIEACERNDQKTITLTVNRMLTGSTVEQWDTMLYFKDTASPQEYDQAIFRLQNQYVKDYKDEEGHIIKFNMKPQTLLVDFDPDRMFRMQEQKSLIYNVNTEEAGNSRLEERLVEELRISPIIALNADKMEQVSAANIMQKIREYSKNKGVAEETIEIPVDLSLLASDAVRYVIERESELGSKEGITARATQGEGEGGDVDTGDVPTDDNPPPPPGDSKDASGASEPNEKQKDPVKQFRTYYSRILFFAFLTKDNVRSLSDILACADSTNNRRILANLGLKISILTIFQDKMNRFTLNRLDYKIQNISELSHDQSLTPIERCAVGIHKFEKLGISEVITPAHICDDMVTLIPDEAFHNAVRCGKKLLDIAGKAGEFAVAMCKRFESLSYTLDDYKQAIYTIPTSFITYEFTRKAYEELGLDIQNISVRLSTYNLLNIKDEDGNIDYEQIRKLLTQSVTFCSIIYDNECLEGEKIVKFEAIVGNPPYMEMDGGAQASARPIYQHFVQIGKELNPSYLSIIMPTRWYAGGKGLDEFRDDMLNDRHIQELHDYLHPEEVFPNTNNRGGICYFLRSAIYDNADKPTSVVTHESMGQCRRFERNLKTRGLDIFVRNSQAIALLNKIVSDDSVATLASHVSAAKAFGFRTFFIRDPKFRASSKGLDAPIKCYGRAKKEGFVERLEVLSHQEWVDKWKVFVPESNNIGTELNDDNQNSIVGAPHTICTETYLVIGANLNLNQEGAENLSKYLRTKFARFLHNLAKVSQHGTSKTYRFVPMQDFTKPWTDEALYKKYSLTVEEIDFIECTIKPME